MKRQNFVCYAPHYYTQPSIEVVRVDVESGFGDSYSQQEPSPWDDM